MDKKVEKRDGTKELRVVLVGKEVADSTIIMAQRRMADYNLGDTKLVVLQGVSGQQAATMDITSVRAQVLEDFYKNGEVKLQQQAVLIRRLLQKKLSKYSSVPCYYIFLQK